MKSKSKKLQGAYVVTEPGCLNPYSGAHQHIQTGIQELQKYFVIEPILPHQSSLDKIKSSRTRSGNRNLKIPEINLIQGTLIDLKVLALSSINSFKLLHQILKRDVEFVYIRAAFLDPLPILLELFKVPCFIEANGLQFEARKKYYPSLLVSVNKLIEKLIYSSAKHVFFVGTYGDYWKLPGDNWSNVENGVEQDFVNSFSNHDKKIGDEINIAFIARLMAYHHPELLIAAIKGIDSVARSKLCLHLVGDGFEEIKAALQDHIKVIDHGFLNRNSMQSLLRKVHIGLIPGAPEYQSQMKLFDYGASKCITIVPDTYNFRYWFDVSEIEFFQSGSASELSSILTKIICTPESYLQKGTRLHQRIAEEFSWRKIFAEKSDVIKKCCSKSN